MNAISFPYEAESSPIFKVVRRPIAQVKFFSQKRKRWLEYTMIVDTGADYTVCPLKVAHDLLIDIEKECNQYLTRGIGGSERVFICKKKIIIKIGNWEVKIPIGFLERDDIPPLLGRQECLDVFDVLFSDFATSFKKSRCYNKNYGKRAKKGKNRWRIFKNSSDETDKGLPNCRNLISTFLV